MSIENLGMGVLIGLMAGNEDSVNAFKEGVGKIIKELSLSENAVHFTFEDGYKMSLFDDGQSCCESRYMACADDLKQFIGAKLLSAEVKSAPNQPDQYGEHEVCFLDVTTDKGVFQVASHNEHNGYYGGFLIRARKD